jgi:hypothetical protein
MFNNIATSSYDGMPVSQQLDRPVLARDIWINLLMVDEQKSPYFELRGCDLEGQTYKSNLS